MKETWRPDSEDLLSMSCNERLESEDVPPKTCQSEVV